MGCITVIKGRVWLENTTIGLATLVVAVLGGAVAFPIAGAVSHAAWHMFLFGWSWIS